MMSINKIADFLWNKGYSGRLLDSFLNLLRKADIEVKYYCDLGCGSGVYSNKVKELFNPPVMVCSDICNNLCIDGFKFVQADFNNHYLPFADNQFDLVTHFNVIEHLYNPDAFIKETYRIIKPGGALCIATNNLSCWTNILSLLFGRQPNAMHASDYGNLGRFLQNDWIRTVPGQMHRRLYSLVGLKKVCLFHGFVNPISTYTVFYPFSGILETILEKLLPIYSAYIILVVRKPS